MRLVGRRGPGAKRLDGCHKHVLTVDIFTTNDQVADIGSTSPTYAGPAQQSALVGSWRDRVDWLRGQRGNAVMQPLPLLKIRLLHFCDETAGRRGSNSSSSMWLPVRRTGRYTRSAVTMPVVTMRRRRRTPRYGAP